MISTDFTNLTQYLAKGQINFSTGTFKCLLVSAAPSEANMDAWLVRQDVLTAAIEVAGTGYTAGGNAVTATVGATDATNNRTAITFGNPAAWTASTITAVGAIIYQVIGTAATDLLVAYLDFGGTITSTADSFTLTLSTPLYITR